MEAKGKLGDRLFLKKEEKLQEGRKRWQRKDEKLEDVVKVTAYTLPPTCLIAVFLHKGTGDRGVFIYWHG